MITPTDPSHSTQTNDGDTQIPTSTLNLTAPDVPPIPAYSWSHLDSSSATLIPSQTAGPKTRHPLSVDLVEVKRFHFSDDMKILLLQSVQEHNAHRASHG